MVPMQAKQAGPHAADDVPVRVAVASASLLGESPFWHPAEQRLYWIDIPGRRLNRFEPRTGVLEHWELESEPGACAPRLDGRLLLAMRDGVFSFDPQTGQRRRLAAPPYDPRVERFNDGKCDPQGRFWIGTIYEPRDRPAAALYCWRGGELIRCADGVTVSNGLAWSPNGRTMYWGDTRAHCVQALDFDPATGEPSRRRDFIRFPPVQPGQPPSLYGGRPDGAAVDVEGCYWVAMFEGGRVLRLSPEGRVLREVQLPARCPTMPCFGGPDLKTVYVTTARHGRPVAELAEYPMSGCVLAFEVEVPGLPVNFAE